MTCHLPNRQLTDADVRQFVSDLANGFPLALLPTASSGEPDQELLAAGTQILNERLTGETLMFEHITNPGSASELMQWNDMSSVSIDDSQRFTTLHVIGGVYPPPAAPSSLRMAGRADDDPARTSAFAMALLPSGTVVLIVTNDPAHLDDVGPALDEILLTIH